MAKVQNSRAKLCQARGFTLDEPPEHLESEGENVVKQMVQQQLKTQTNLLEILNQEQRFTSVTEIIPFTEYICGETTLERFEQTAEKVARIEQLKSRGLSNDEIKLLFDYENGKVSKTFKKVESSVLATQINGILEKIQQETPNKSVEQKIETRSLNKEIGLCVKPESKHTKLLNFVLSCEKAKQDTRPPNHPINNLKSIEQNLFGHISKKQKIPLRKARDIVHVASESDQYLLPYKSGESLWDVKGGNINCSVNESCSGINKNIYTCKNQMLYTIQNGEIIEANHLENKRKNESQIDVKNGDVFVVPDLSLVSLIPLDEIEKNRLSVNDIRLLPKFCNYMEGSPSRVLYLKNLSRGISKTDLALLFGHFDSDEEHRIMYRLMTGRMKGQAFVTFPNVQSAQKALKLVNGFIFKGRPIVIQNSRREFNGILANQ